MVDWKSQNLAYKIVDNVCRMVGLAIVLLLHCCTGKLSRFRLLETGKQTCLKRCRLSDNREELQIPQSSVGLYFEQQPSGKWQLQIPEDPIAKELHRSPLGFVTSGVVRGRLVYFCSDTSCMDSPAESTKVEPCRSIGIMGFWWK